MKNKLIGRSIIVASLLLTGVWAAADANQTGTRTETKKADIITDNEKKISVASYVLPSPDTMYTAFNKVKTNVAWEKYITNNSNISYETDPQIAYNLGLQLSDAFLLFTAQKLSSKNITMIELLASKLGVSENIVKRVGTIKAALLVNKTKVVKQELTYMNDEINQALNSHSRMDLAAIVNAGAWIGAISATTNLLKADYSKDAASFLAQKDVITALYKSLENRQSLVFDTITQETISSLKEIESVIGTKKELTKDDIEKINHIITRVVTLIEKI